jgi:hypothetical protein
MSNFGILSRQNFKNMAVVLQKSLSVCNAQRFAVSRFSQADAPRRCLSAYRASEIPLADGRLFQKRQSEGKADSVVACSSREQDIVVDIDVEASDRASRSLESLRRKRLRRNKKKREAIKMMSKSERKTRYSCRAKKQVEAEILAKTEKRHSELKDRCIEYQTRYEKEKGKKLKSYRYLVFHILIYLFIGL